MIWGLINAICSVIVAAIIAYDLVCYPEKFTAVERVGMGLIGGSAVLTIGPLWAGGTPFDDWATALLRFGCAVYFVGRMTRHQFNNWLAKRQSRQHFGGRA